MFACLLLTAGSLGDRYGRKYALRFGLIWFGTFSAIASLASSPGMLIVTRGLMGLGAAFIYPTTLSIITNTFHVPRERARAIGVWAGVAGVGIALGPLLGGLLVENFGWPAVFLINVPVCTIAVLLAHWFVPNSSARDESPLDPLGAVLSIFALGVAPVRHHRGARPRVDRPARGGCFVVGAAFLASFIWWERHTPRPMLDVRIFKNPRFSAASATITLTQFAMFGSTFLLTQYFQFRLGYSPLKSGIMLMPVAIGLMVGSPNAPKFVHRFGTTRVVVIGPLRGVGCDRLVHVGRSDVVVRDRLRHPADLRARHGHHDGAGHRVDHGIAATRARRRRFGDQRHHAPDRWCARCRGARQHLRLPVPPRDRHDHRCVGGHVAPRA